MSIQIAILFASLACAQGTSLSNPPIPPPLSVDSGKLSAASVDSEKVAQGSIGKVHLVNLTIESSKLAVNSVDSEKIVAGSVSTVKLLTSGNLDSGDIACFLGGATISACRNQPPAPCDCGGQ